MEVIKRSTAKAEGLSHYFTGKPCKNGHLEIRLVTNGTCIRCNADAQLRYKLDKKDLMRQKFRSWRIENLEYDKDRKAHWRKTKPHKNAEKSRRYEATKRGAIPSWADNFVIEGMYELASVFRRIGLNIHVDHIVPLKGKTVCGLHTHDNLQLLTGSENSRKFNSFWPDMP